MRVHFDLLYSLFNVVGELIITKNHIDTLLSDTTDKALKTSLATMDRMVGKLQEDVSAARLVPVDEVFQKFPRMVRDLAREKHKEIELVLEGRDIESPEDRRKPISRGRRRLNCPPGGLRIISSSI